MYPTFNAEIATQHIDELHQQAARRHMLRQLRGGVRAASTGNGRVAGRLVRIGLSALPAGH